LILKAFLNIGNVAQYIFYDYDLSTGQVMVVKDPS